MFVCFVVGEVWMIRGEISCVLSVRVGRFDCLLRREVMTICDIGKGCSSVREGGSDSL